MTPDRLRTIAPSLGWPWEALAESEAARLDAWQAAELAIAAGDDGDRAVAEELVLAAIDGVQVERNKLGAMFALLFRCACEMPGQTRIHKGKGEMIGSPEAQEFHSQFVRPAELEDVATTVAKLERQVAKLERQVWRLEVENRELADVLVAMEAGRVEA